MQIQYLYSQYTTKKDNKTELPLKNKQARVSENSVQDFLYLSFRSLFLTVSFFFIASGQHCHLCMCHYCGRHVLLHGRPQAPEGISGGQAVTRSQAEPGGAESATGQRANTAAFWCVCVTLKDPGIVTRIRRVNRSAV